MTIEVKPGQVWASKNTGAQWTVRSGPDEEDFFTMENINKTNRVIHVNHIVDDYMLVKDAP